MLNVAALAAITLLIFAEKTLRRGPLISRLGAAALIGYGLLAVAAPRVLPAMSM
jgi:predicted metal-binding membrane protein